MQVEQINWQCTCSGAAFEDVILQKRVNFIHRQTTLITSARSCSETRPNYVILSLTAFLLILTNIFAILCNARQRDLVEMERALVACLAYPSTLQKEAAGSYETSVNYQPRLIRQYSSYAAPQNLKSKFSSQEWQRISHRSVGPHYSPPLVAVLNHTKSARTRLN
jgi:hypothetical protein